MKEQPSLSVFPPALLFIILLFIWGLHAVSFASYINIFEFRYYFVSKINWCLRKSKSFLMIFHSAHGTLDWAFENMNFHWVVVKYRGIFDFENQNLANSVSSRHRPFVLHIFLELQVHKELAICLTVNEVLCDNIIRSISKVFIGDGLYFESKIKIGQIFERNWGHSNLIFFSWNLDHLGVLVWFVQVFNACDLGNFTLGANREIDRLKALQLHL